MIFSKRSYEGCIVIDHRASPGIPLEIAQQLSSDPDTQRALGEGKIFEAPTAGCPHCGGCVILNPKRVRSRAHCYKCNSYICDWCEAASREPDYVHRTVDSIYELLLAGWSMSGSTTRPILTPPKGK